MQCPKCGRTLSEEKIEHEECRNLKTPKQLYDEFAETFTEEERSMASSYFDIYFLKQYRLLAAFYNYCGGFGIQRWYWEKRCIALEEARKIVKSRTISVKVEFKIS